MALGAWAPQLAKFHLRCWIERQVMVWYAHHDAAVSGFSFPAEPPATSIYGVPEGGGKIKVAIHHGGPPTEPDSVSPVSDTDTGAVRRMIAERVPMLTGGLPSSTCID